MLSAMLVLCASLCASPCLVGDTYEFPDDTLSLDLRKLKDVVWVEDEIESGVFDTAVRCHGRFGALQLELTLRRDVTTNTEWLPQDVLWVVQDELQEADPGFVFPRRMALASDAGKVSYLLAGIDNPPRGDETRRALIAFCGVTEGSKYAIEVRSPGSLSDRDIESLTDWIADALDDAGPVRDPDWTEAELQALWLKAAPDALADKLKVLRTEHYVILTSTDVAKDFGKSIEGCHEMIEELFPAPALEGYRLLPMVLLRSKSEYVKAYLKVNEDSTYEKASRTYGSCEGEYCLTWHDGGDPLEHVYIVTQQYVRNRHWLIWGGTWFKVGLGEYLETTDDERKEFSEGVGRGRFVPLEEFMLMPTFALTSGERNQFGENIAVNLYDQAAALVEFFVKSKVTRKRSVEFLQVAGNLRREDRTRLEHALREFFDLDFAGLEEEFVDYWKKWR